MGEGGGGHGGGELVGCCRMFESTVQLSSETDASFYNAEAFEMHIRTLLFFLAGMRA